MRLLERSATKSRPAESIASRCGTSNSPGPVPFLPHSLMYLPSLVNFTIRLFESPPCPSATKISPLGATRMSEGALKVSGVLPATPGLPKVINSLPSWLNFITVWPLPLFMARPSVTQILLSGSMCSPCG